MMTEKSCNLSEQRADLPREYGSGSGWVSSDKYLTK